MGLNITVMSYMGHMDFGIVADRDQMPDVWRLIDYLETSSRSSARPSPRRTPTSRRMSEPVRASSHRATASQD